MMKSNLPMILGKLKQAETCLGSLSQEFQRLETEKQAYLREIMMGAQRSKEVKDSDQAIKQKGVDVSKAKEEVSNLRAQLEAQLGEFRKHLIEEKQADLNRYLEQKTQYLKRIEELELETSRYRYLITGKKDRRLANEKDLLPLENREQSDFAPIDELIGRIKLEVSRINRMNSEALLTEYLAREEQSTQGSGDPGLDE